MSKKKPIYSNKRKGRFSYRNRNQPTESERPLDYTEKTQFKSLHMYVPLDLFDRIKEAARQSGVPMGWFTLRSLLKRLLADDFKSDSYEIPSEVLDKNNLERIGKISFKIFKFIEEFKHSGVSVEMAYLSMLETGAEHPSEWLDAYRHLLNTGAVVEFRGKEKGYTVDKVMVTDYAGDRLKLKEQG